MLLKSSLSMQMIPFGVTSHFFQEVERKYTDLLSEYGSTEEISAELFKTEMGNLECLGYGAKAFTISMVETALRVSGQKISAEKIQQIILFR